MFMGDYALATKKYSGVTINVSTVEGSIGRPVVKRAKEFESLTGAKINVILVRII